MHVLIGATLNVALLFMAGLTAGALGQAQTRFPPAPAHFIPDGAPFTLPTAPLRDIYVDSARGDDSRSGATPAAALRTVSEAWRRVPLGRLPAGGGVRIVLQPGAWGQDAVPEYWEGRWGSPDAPIIITSQAYLHSHLQPNTTTTTSSQPQQQQGSSPQDVQPQPQPPPQPPGAPQQVAASATIARVNMFNVSGVYLLGFTIADPGDAFHCERCVGLHLRHMRVLADQSSAWEIVKLNQCAGVFVEGCSVAGAGDNAIDMVAVQYGHVTDCDVHSANWCMYLKGGSAYFRIERNFIHHCGESGFAAGQGTGLQYMVEPWVQYEVYDLHVVNNVISDVWGAGLGVYGGLHVLMAHNTLLRVGSRSHAVEFNTGSRVCDPDDAAPRCRALRRGPYGAWGPVSVADNPPNDRGVAIPSRDVIFVNNLIANPGDNATQWQHIQVMRPQPAEGGVPGPSARADEGLVIAGNIFWDGGNDKALGVEDPEGLDCPQQPLAPGEAAPPGCRVAQLLRDNVWSGPGAAPEWAGGAAAEGRDSPAAAEQLAAAVWAAGGLALRRGSAGAAAAARVLVAPLPQLPPWPAEQLAPPGAAAVAPVVADVTGRQRGGGYDAPGAFALGGAPAAAPSPSPRPTASPRASPAPVPSPMPVPVPSPRASPKPSPTPAPVPSPSPSPSPKPAPSPKRRTKHKKSPRPKKTNRRQ
ncbi:hypothetical protein HYH02_009700 [Chlamydomonas schloesseri]|uniref:Right handed beta helix domain-containing protein n=1 Tax=Chlamydomonas schloesseri TaxID=2026947 RepID=A0A835TDS3_9CHLO|nr:hypothetical protein HYH02_009700 [Chlamydomonas schloesseri]|eukprot:KAG2442216.1 hypothetical protein HYH02_009700 [Chlamydomonas schloesseri]